MAVVTVVGAGGTHVSVTVNGGGATTLAQAYASAVNGAASSNTLFASQGGPGTTPTAPTGGSAINEFVATSGGYYAVASGYDHFVTQTTSPVTISSGSSTTTLSTLVGTGGATFLAGNESGTFIAGGGNNLFINSGTGAYTVATSDGNDTIFAGSGATSVDAGTGTNLINLGSGSDTVTSSGVGDKIFAGSGPDTVNLTATGATVYGSAGTSASLAVFDTSGTASFVSGGSEPTTIFGGTGGTYTLTGNASVFGGSGDTIAASGNTFISGTTGGLVTSTSSLLFVGGTGSETVNSGSGAATVFGTSGSNITYSGSGILVAGNGNETLNGAGSTQGFAGFVSNITANTAAGADIIGGSGADTLVAGLGVQTLTGGSGSANLFVLAENGTQSSANITISDFGSATGNMVGLFGYGANEVATALNTATNSASGVQIKLGDGSTVTFTGLTTTTLNHASFFGD